MTGKKKNKSKKDEPNSEFEKFQRLLKDTLSVPKEELDKRRAKYKNGQDKKK